ncbi:hypothetical protein FA95DRAFT_1598368 [Auriscalpium vulgare]|uniref:Uncharacterized protein n=1 Tax=Auriscalpium vulgare TaxID=40419 RepID=A0ACB8REV8_9AGAM|nr:hypothetical protein FA95DRAFT_1598368 [Auriscalpium vulgare]
MPFGLIRGSERVSALEHTVSEELKKRGYEYPDYKVMAKYIIYLIMKNQSPDVFARTYDRNFTDWLFAEAAKGAPESERSYTYPPAKCKEPDTFATMRNRMMPVWTKRPDILWVGMSSFDPQSEIEPPRESEAESDSDGGGEHKLVDLAVVFKEVQGRPPSNWSLKKALKKATGRHPDLMTITQKPSAIERNTHMIKAILLARTTTIYGDYRDIEPLMKEALTVTQHAMRVFNEIREALPDIDNQAQTPHSFEEFIQPDCQAVRKQSVTSISKIFDIMASSPDYMRRDMTFGLAQAVENLHARLPHDTFACTDADIPVWRQVWSCVMTGDDATWHKHVAFLLRPFQEMMTELEDSGELEESGERD